MSEHFKLVCMCIYIYTYMHRERERNRDKSANILDHQENSSCFTGLSTADALAGSPAINCLQPFPHVYHLGWPLSTMRDKELGIGQ